MATNNSVNSPLSGTTGTGNFVGSTSPTITTPRIAQINDANGNANIATTGPVSPVNYWTSVSSATGGFTGFEVTGTDTNANGYIKAKGDAAIAIITSAVTENPLVIYSGTGQQHVTSFAFSNTAQNRLVTFPDLTGTVNMGLATGGIQAWVNFNGTGTVAIRASSNVSSITDNGTGDYTVNYTSALSSANYSFIGTGSYYSGNYRGAVIISMSGTSTATLYSTTQTRFLTDNAQTDTRQDAGYICCATFL